MEVPKLPSLSNNAVKLKLHLSSQDCSTGLKRQVSGPTVPKLPPFPPQYGCDVKQITKAHQNQDKSGELATQASEGTNPAPGGFILTCTHFTLIPGHTNFLQMRLALLSPQVMG